MTREQKMIKLLKEADRAFEYIYGLAARHECGDDALVRAECAHWRDAYREMSTAASRRTGGRR